MALTGFSGFRILLVVSLCGTLVQGQQISEPKPIWSTDLRQAGYVPDPGFRSFFFTFSSDPRRTISQVSDDAVAFGGGGHLAVAFLTQEFGGKRQSFDSVDAARKLHIILLDAATGRILVNRTWPGQQASSNKAYATKDGDFVLLHGNALYVYSPDLQQVNRVDVPADPKVFLVPPGTDSVFLQHYLKGSWSLRMLSAPTLREIRSWDKSVEISSASEKYLATIGKGNTLYARGFDTPWRAIGELGSCHSGVMRAEARFINEDLIVVGGCDPIQVIRVDGQVLFKTHPPTGHSAGDGWGSPDGRFVAVASYRWKGVTIETLDMYRYRAPWRILVYDTGSGKAVSALPFTRRTACAFSPDSSALALLSGGIIELYSLPRANR
jgi:hypothetical protein